MADELEGAEGDSPSPLPSNRDDEFRQCSVHLSAGCRNGNFGTSFLPCVLLAAAERSPPRLQAIYDPRDLNLLLQTFSSVFDVTVR